MWKLNRALLLGSIICGSAVLVGCGDSATDNKPQVIVPDVPPGVANKDSMDAYLKGHPQAAKKAGKGVAPN